jgi:hypothetical protein
MPSRGRVRARGRCELAAGEFDEEGLAGAGEGAEELAVGGDAGEGGCGAALEGFGEGFGWAGDQDVAHVLLADVAEAGGLAAAGELDEAGLELAQEAVGEGAPAGAGRARP